jgi:hypothetical protein
MLRIVAIEPNPDANREFIVLQNRGFLTVQLRGHALMDEDTATGDADRLFPLVDDVRIPSSAYVLVATGSGMNGWARCSDGSIVYQVFLNRRTGEWCHSSGAIYLLSPTHTKRPSARAGELSPAGL